MKSLIILLSLIFIPKQCNTVSSNYTELQKRQETITITYQAVSRGFFEEISISSDSITISNNINRKNVKTYNSSIEDWNTCLELLSKIKINGLSILKAPTTFRYADGAAHATLIIKDGDKEIRSSEFDHGHPPQEIKELVEKLQSFKKLSSKQ
ncbi:hypothetical protein [Pontimicrobium aquaticum]|uniref:Uncharacterized protein n=1 Tax=Pontimicrobium aquaticum TaxID=2565367 RepID=A0A4U0F1F0_9FLAO|nr:hypothetical protein [Pontimicrobium aquaticum]TJY38088.1 hypothetical protein E5167_02180 [Pontimicrobium aquaticum]